MHSQSTQTEKKDANYSIMMNTEIVNDYVHKTRNVKHLDFKKTKL